MVDLDKQELFPPQREVMEAGLLEEGKHLLLNMTTGSGKTFLAELAIEDVIHSGYKAVYLTPLKALASQQQRDWANRFPGTVVGVFTGDTLWMSKSKYSYQESQLLIMTPERMDACLRNWRKHWSWIPEISLVVVDEFHLLGQDLRGARLEGIMTRLMRLNPFVRFIGLSATMPNADRIAEWLHGRYYRSEWRQIPLGRIFERFKSAKEKPALLLSVVRDCIEDGGQSLIFCNSRKRTQEMATLLSDNGIPAACHHAGLMPDERERVEAEYRSGALRVLVATSTLEMGLNVPARQVVLYDTYVFKPEGFEDLPVWSYIQRSGRAGRPGLDSQGQAVMLLPRWVDRTKYEYGWCEPVNSQLTDQRYMQEQILIEVFAGYSRTARELTEGFLPLTFYKAQHKEATISRLVNSLLLGDLLYETETESSVLDRPLKVGLLGQLAIRLMFSVETVRMVKAVYGSGKRLFLFDILLMAGLSPDCEPVLRANFEETDALCEVVQQLPSMLLECTVNQLGRIVGEEMKVGRLLAGVKMAAICHCLTTEMSIDEIAKRFMIYPADVYALRDNVIRVLQGIGAIISAIDKKELGEEAAGSKRSEYDSAYSLAGMLTDMLRYRLSSELAALTMLPGVGGQRARALADEGFDTISSIAEASPAVLRNVDGIGSKLSSKLVEDAKKILNQGEIRIYREDPVMFSGHRSEKKVKIDPYRLARSAELSVVNFEGDRFLVRGGREDHVIIGHGDDYCCDCMDFQKKGGHCKHILCVRRALGDENVVKAFRQLQASSNRSIREDLPILWYQSAERRKE